MPSLRLSVRIFPPVLERLESFVDQHNLTVSEGVIAAIARYIGETDGVPLVERVRQVEQRLAQLEGKG
jgi:CTP synthase (UTP-ammonia lyase)